MERGVADGDREQAQEAGRGLRFLRVDPEHLPPVSGAHRRPDTDQGWPGRHAEEVRGPRMVRVPDKLRRRNVPRFAALQQARHDPPGIQHRGGRRLSQGLRVVPRAQAAHLPGSYRGQQPLQPGLPHLLRRRPTGVQPVDGTSRADAGPVHPVGRRAGGSPVQRGRAHHPPGNPANAADGIRQGHPRRNAQHQRHTHCQGRPLPGRPGRHRPHDLPPVRRLLGPDRPTSQYGARTSWISS